MNSKKYNALACYAKQNLCNIMYNLSSTTQQRIQGKFLGVKLINLSGSKVLTGVMIVAIHKADQFSSCTVHVTTQTTPFNLKFPLLMTAEVGG